jgi:putative membrane protein
VTGDTDDYTHRTLLANERTYLAWWRTGLTALTVALAAARLVPELGKVTHRWPYTVVGAGFALLGTLCLGYAERRRRSVGRSVRAGEFTDPGRGVMLALTWGGALLGVALLAIIVLDA